MTYDAGRARAIYEIHATQAEATLTRLKRMYGELQAAQQQATARASLPGISAPGGGGTSAPRAASFAQEARAVASLEAQQARLARAQGDAARAAALEAQAQQTLTAALVRADTTTVQAIGLQRQLASVQTQAARGAQAGGVQALDQIRGGLVGIVGPAAAATAALGAVNAVVRDTQAGFQLRAQIDQTQRSIALQVAGLRDSAVMFERARAFGDRYRLTQEETNNALRASTSILRQSRASTEEVLGTLLRLQQFSPEQGIEGAALALKELQGASTTSLTGRFEVSIGAAAKLREEIRGGADAVQVMNRFLTESGIGMEALDIRTQGAIGRMNELSRLTEERQLALAGQFGGLGEVIGDVTEGFSRGLNRLLGAEGGLGRGLQVLQAQSAAEHAFAEALRQGASEADAAAVAQTAYNTSLAASTPVTQQAAQSSELLGLTQEQAARNTALLAGQQAHLRDEHLQVGQIVQQTSAQVQEFNARLSENAAQAQISAAQASLLRARQEEIAQASVLAARGLLGSGDQALLMAKKYNIARDQAELLVNEQRRLDAAQGLRDQRAGERSGGAVRTEAELRAQNKARQLNADFERQQEEKRKQQQQAQNALDLARARTPAQRIAILQREQAATTDVAEKLRLQAQIEGERRSGAQAHTAELGKQLSVEQKILDTKESQLKASIDARKLAAQDTLDRLKEDQELARARNALENARDPRFRQAAQARIDLIAAERDSRALAIQQAQATAGGRAFVPGALPGGAPIPPLPGPGGGAAPGAAGAQQAAGGIQVLVFIDSEQVAARVETRVIGDLRASRQQSASAGGGVR